MIQDHRKLWSLIDEYRRLTNLQGYTPQTRGQRLNGFIAELFRCWGIPAQANVRGAGEVDVGFQLDGRYYVVEAKWESTGIGTGPIAKLQKRLRQRFAGTGGVFISLSGYTPEAIQDLKEGEQLGILLLTKEHLESMLSGFVPPAELLRRLITKASFLGHGYVPLTQLFSIPEPDDLEVDFSCPPELQTLIEEAVPGFRAKVLASSLPRSQIGVAEFSSEEVLLTLDQGLFMFHLPTQTFSVRLPFPDCSRNPVVSRSNAVYIVRKAGVARFDKKELTFVGGGYCGNTCLFKGPDNEIGVFANGYPGSFPYISLLKSELGSEVRFEVDYPSACGMNAAQIDGDHFLITGSGGIAIAGLNGSCDIISRDLTNPMGLLQQSTTDYIVASGGVELSELHIDRVSTRQIASFNLMGSVSEIAQSIAGGGYLFSHYSDHHGKTKGVLVKWHC